MRWRTPVDLILPSLRIRYVSERALTTGATCLKMSRVMPGTLNNHAVFAKYPFDCRYEMMLCASWRSTPGRQINTSRLAVLILMAPGLLPLSSRSEEHTSELQSRGHLVCRLLLEKK